MLICLHGEFSLFIMIITSKTENQHVDKTKAIVDKNQAVNKIYLLTLNT